MISLKEVKKSHFDNTTPAFHNHILINKVRSKVANCMLIDAKTKYQESVSVSDHINVSVLIYDSGRRTRRDYISGGYKKGTNETPCNDISNKDPSTICNFQNQIQ